MWSYQHKTTYTSIEIGIFSTAKTYIFYLGRMIMLPDLMTVNQFVYYHELFISFGVVLSITIWTLPLVEQELLAPLKCLSLCSSAISFFAVLCGLLYFRLSPSFWPMYWLSSDFLYLITLWTFWLGQKQRKKTPQIEEYLINVYLHYI